MNQAGKVDKGADKRARPLTIASSESNNKANEFSEDTVNKRAKHDSNTQKSTSAESHKNNSSKKNSNNSKWLQSHLHGAKATKRKQPRSMQQRGKSGNKLKSDGERYAVIITNVENDFSKVHEELLQFHCHLDPTHKQSEFTSLSPSLTTQHCEELEKSQQKEVKQQSESDMSNVAEAKLDASCDLTEKKECSDANVEVDKEQSKCCVYQLKCRNETRSAELTVYGNSLENISSIFVAPSAKTQQSNPSAQQFTSLKKMINKVSHKPYFDHMLKFYLNSSDAAVQLPSSEKNNNNDVNSERNDINDGETAAETDTKETNKKAEDGATNSSASYKNDTETSQMVQIVKTQKEKLNLRQRDLVTAIAEISVPLSNNELRTRFAVLPHFVSSWQIRPRTFRVVFANEQSLFDAKQLLDQFELDGNVRVLLRLSDDLQKRFTSFLAALDTNRE